MRLDLRTPRVVLITGAGSGIGRATAIELAHAATTVVVTDIDDLSAQQTVDLVRAKGGHAEARRLDVTDSAAWEELAAELAAGIGVPDVLVNNAGFVVGGAFLDHSAEDWERQLAVNLFGVIHGCRTFGRAMVDRGAGGHIVNIASAASFTPVPSMPAYCVSKAGVKMASECLRQELAPHGIGVTAICPGFINTNIGDHGVMVGVDDAAVGAGKEALERLRALGDRLPFDIASPAGVARAVHAAVRLDPAVLPVRPEAWYGYVMSRVSPGLVRRTTQPFSAAAAQRLLDRVPPGILRRLLPPAAAQPRSADVA
jgi:NAD(P)-dependent dehydrogenase (short-subunit alcohol dehydrogenase family)